jgi:hypothetical protein
MPETPPPTDTVDDRTTVLALLQMSGLHPTETEIEKMIAGYPTSRAMVDSLYTLPGVRYEEPAVTFDPRVVAP